ncbi:MAG: DNA polymerase IV [Bacteroidota bacterium]
MHPSPPHRAIAHLDLDAFFASVECLKDGRLRGRPLIIGGRGDRSVVASCSYEARHFGVRSAMPMKLALQLCPDATVISGDMESYSQYSHMVTEIIREEAPLFEKASIDEFYLDVSGMDRFFSTTQWSTELRQRIMQETGLPISMGVSSNKLVSKVATGEAKPNGQQYVPYGTERAFLAPLPVTKIPMVGPKTAQFLSEMGIRTVQTLSEMPLEMLRSAFGKQGVALWKRAQGIDDTPVMAYSERKSISTETTFDQDTIDVRKLKAVLTGMVEKVGFRLRRHQKLTACITVKLRYSNFDTVTRQVRLPYTASDHMLMQSAHELFDKLYQRRMLVRLVGVRLSHLVHGSHQINLFEDTQEDVQLYQAIDFLKHKYGPQTLTRAVTMGARVGTREQHHTL